MIAETDPEKLLDDAVAAVDAMSAQEKAPELSAKDYQAVFHIMLLRLKSVSVSKKVLDAFPGGQQFECHWDAVNEMWHFFIPRKNRPNIVAIKKKLIVPNNGG